MSDIVVVGSVNLDLALTVPHIPIPGQTVLADAPGISRGPGGKSANQAVAIARLGASVALVARVGRDEAGRHVTERLRAEGVDVTAIRQDPLPTGTAVVLVEGSGENAIVVSSGANAALSPADADREHDRLTAAHATLLGLEVPVETALRAAQHSRGVVILNPAPARPLPRELLRRVHALVPNRVELAMLLDAPIPTSHADVARLAGQLPVRVGVVVTLGRDGALVVQAGRATHIPAVRVNAVDTVGAGDAFCAALTVGLTRSMPLIAAAERAVHAGALAATQRAAHAALPPFADLARATSTSAPPA